jgi:hypothetical protein
MRCLDAPDLEAALYRLYREFFDRAKRKRRWSLRDDIPWRQCGGATDPAVADAVELYLPDYVANAMRVFRPSRACSWFYADWATRSRSTSWPYPTGCSAPAAAPRSNWPTWRARSCSGSGTCRTTAPSPCWPTP